MMGCSVDELLHGRKPGAPRIRSEELAYWLAHWELKNKDMEKAAKRRSRG